MKPLIIGHRGTPIYAKENTLLAFEKAIAFGADMIEFDVRRTRDRVPVVFHDAYLGRKPLRKLTYAELHELEPDIPTLKEAIAFCKGRIRLDVELKGAGYERDAMELLLNAFSPDEFVITSFHPFAIRKVKQHYPDVKAGFLFGHGTVNVCRSLRWNAKAVSNRIRATRADFIAPNWELLDSQILSRVLGYLPIWVWTVNDTPMMERLLSDRRVEGIITDRPDVGIYLRQHLNRNVG
ncbi:MAG TPA: glycerophosphodiester phosphodiesterase [Crinalium sp.]|jgi:glycerophosphoryl diester phosphodiesterase